MHINFYNQVLIMLPLLLIINLKKTFGSINEKAKGLFVSKVCIS